MKNIIAHILFFLLGFVLTIFILHHLRNKWMLDGALIGYHYFKTEYSECVLNHGGNNER